LAIAGFFIYILLEDFGNNLSIARRASERGI